MSPRRNAFLLWLCVLIAPAVLAAETPAPAPRAAEASLPADLYLIAVGHRSALTERYLHALCERLSGDPHGRQRFHRARILRNDTQDLRSIKNELANQDASVPLRTATDLGMFLDALKRGSVECLEPPSAPPAGASALASEVPDTERPTLLVMAESIGGEKVDEVRLVRFLLDPAAPPGARKRLDPLTYVEGENANELGRKMGLAMLALPEASLFQAVLTLEGSKYLPCTTPTSACVVPGEQAKLSLEVRDTPWLAAHEVSVSFRAHCDTPANESLARLFDESAPPSEARPGAGRVLFSRQTSFSGVGSCAFEARLSERTGRHVAIVSGARLEVKALPLLVTPWPISPGRTNYLLVQRKRVPWASSSPSLYSDDDNLKRVRLLSGEEILLLGQRLRKELLRIGAPPDVPELTPTLNGRLAEALESFHDSLGYTVLRQPDAESKICGSLRDTLETTVRAHQLSPEYLGRWWGVCSWAIRKERDELARVLRQREQPRFQVSRLPGEEHLPYRAIENLRDARSVEVKAEELQFARSLEAPFRAEEDYLVSASTDSGESSRPMRLHVESDAGPPGFELGPFVRLYKTEDGATGLGTGLDFQVRALDGVLLATVMTDVSYQWSGGQQPAQAQNAQGFSFGLIPGVGVDFMRLRSWYSADTSHSFSFNVGYDLLRRSVVYSVNAGILVNRKTTSYFNRPSDGARFVISMQFIDPRLHRMGGAIRLGMLF